MFAEWNANVQVMWNYFCECAQMVDWFVCSCNLHFSPHPNYKHHHTVYSSFHICKCRPSLYIHM